jgi:hypothetical protein
MRQKKRAAKAEHIPKVSQNKTDKVKSNDVSLQNQNPTSVTSNQKKLEFPLNVTFTVPIRVCRRQTSHKRPDRKIDGRLCMLKRRRRILLYAAWQTYSDYTSQPGGNKTFKNFVSTKGKVSINPK